MNYNLKSLDFSNEVLFAVSVYLIPHHVLFQFILSVCFIFLVKIICIKEFFFLIPFLVDSLAYCKVDFFEVLYCQRLIRDSVVNDNEI
jgi:hypothetical protein